MTGQPVPSRILVRKLAGETLEHSHTQALLALTERRFVLSWYSHCFKLLPNPPAVCSGLIPGIQEGTCIRGDNCPYAHNVFEYWLHPTR